MKTFHNFAEALIGSTKTLFKVGEHVESVKDPLSVGSAHGRASRPFVEIAGYGFRILDPRSNLVARPTRPINISFLISNLLWVVSGSNRVEDIRYWNPRAGAFSDDGDCVRGGAGPRVFGNFSQFQMAAERIRSDPSTRRSVILFIDASDLQAHTRDVPCMTSLQFLLRGNRLHAITTMRSQSAIMVMPYDVSLLTGLQDLMANEVGAEIGTYTHFASSFHVYEDELYLAQDVAAGNIEPRESSKICSLPDLRQLAEMAKSLAASDSADDIMATNNGATTKGRYFSDAAGALAGTSLLRAGHRESAHRLWSRSGTFGELSALHAGT